MARRDDRLEIRAMQQRWPISAKYREFLINKLLKIALDEATTNRESIMAAKALLSAEAQNQTDEHTAAVQSDRNRFLEVARQLGIEADFRLVTQERTDSDNGGFDGAERAEPDTGQGYRAETFDKEQSS